MQQTEEWNEVAADDLIDRARAQRREFLVGRQRGVGTSDYLGTAEHPRLLDGGALEVYYEKTRQIDEGDLDDAEVGIDILRGRLLEPIAAALYWRHTGRKGKREFGQKFHPDYPGAMTSADGTIFATSPNLPEWAEGTGGAEFKAPRWQVMQALAEKGTREGIVLQIQGSLAVRRLSWGSLGFVNLEHRSGPIVPVDVAADPAVAQFLLEISAEFWERHVVPRVPPDPRKWAELYGKAPPVRLDTVDKRLTVLERDEAGQVEQLTRRFIELTNLRKECEETRAAIGAELDELLRAEHPGRAKFQLPSVAKITRVTTSRETLKEDWLAAAQPIDRDAFVRFMREEVIPDAGQAALDAIADRLRIDLRAFKQQSAPSSYLLVTPAREES